MAVVDMTYSLAPERASLKEMHVLTDYTLTLPAFIGKVYLKTQTKNSYKPN